jgi:BirA family transcriptional regulator, biotin operon repressor / biotin---[acetyl-CoA-carboxylase] ligase
LNSNPFDEALERSRGRLGRLATSVRLFPTIGSTNDHAASLGIEGAVVIADQQTAGRGRRGHSWFSPAGSGLYVSVVLTPARAATDPQRATMLVTMMAGVALAEAIEAATGVRVTLKWPNDLFIGHRKVGGILAEASGTAAPSAAAVTVGYGINVKATSLPADLATRATSLESECGREVDRAHVLVETLAVLAARYDDLLTGRFDAILERWRAHAPAAHGARVRWTTLEGPAEGTTAGIDRDGALLVTIGSRTERIVSGELEWLA